MSPERIPSWKLERALLGEAKLNEQDEGTRQRLLELARSNEEILRAHPPARIAAEIRQRLEREGKPQGGVASWMSIPVLGMAVAAALIALTVRPLAPDGSGP